MAILPISSNSFSDGSSLRSLSPNWIRNSLVVLYRIGLPITFLRPASVISFRSSSVFSTPPPCTPRISMISGVVTGCLYAITASVSSAGRESLNGVFRLLTKLRTAS